MDKAFIAAMDRARHGVPRSQWVRMALANYLRANGEEIPEGMENPPDRAAFTLNESSSDAADLTETTERLGRIDAQAAAGRRREEQEAAVRRHGKAGPSGGVSYRPKKRRRVAAKPGSK